MVRLLAVLPALNEEQSVAQVVTGVRSNLGCDVLVVDDGSTDATTDAATGAGALVLRHPFNLGVGAAIRTGLRFALERGYDAVVQVDADGQHEPADAARLVAVVTEGRADLVVGSRFEAGYEVGRFRQAAQRLLARIVSRRLGVTLTDATSGFRAFGAKAIEQFAADYPTAFLSDTVEALLLAGDYGLVVAEEPVQMHPRRTGQPSARRVASTFHLVRLFLVIALHPIRRPTRRTPPSPEPR